MSAEPDLTKVSPIGYLRGETMEETIHLKKMHREAYDYLTSFAWCRNVQSSYFGLGVGGVIGVFLFKIEPDAEDIDAWIWVINGDVPPAYIAALDIPNPACALEAYIGAMHDWVEAALLGKPIDDLIPVNVAATPANAQKLKVRLDFLENEILSHYADDLAASE